MHNRQSAAMPILFLRRIAGKKEKRKLAKNFLQRPSTARRSAFFLSGSKREFVGPVAPAIDPAFILLPTP